MIFGRGSDTNVALLWDESTDQFAFINTDEAGLTSGDVTIASYSDLKVNDLIADNVTGATIVATTGFTGNLTGNVIGSTTGINYGNVTSTVGTSTFNNITMAGNLIVNGSTTTVSSTNTTLTDNLIELNTGAGSNDADAGIVIERGTTGDNAFMGWDESSDSFILGTTTATGSSIGNLTITPTALQLGSLDITDTTAGSDAGPIVTLHRDITGADANYIGQIKFTADNDANQSTVFAKITGKIDDASDGTEDGIIEIAHKKAGSNNISARFTSTDLKLINGTGLEVAGETTLSGTLNVTQESTADTIKLTRGTTAHNNMIKFVTGSTGKWIVGQRNDSTDHFRFYSYGTSSDVLSIQTDGNVGIGTSSPASLLHVKSSTIDARLQLTNSTSADDTTGSGASIQLFNDDLYLNAVENAGNIIFRTDGGTGGFAERMRINSSGNVGIGTTSLSDKLTVNGSINLPTVNTFIKGGGHNVVQVDATRTYLYGGTNGVQFRTADNASALVDIDNAGNVGIGTSSPSEVLHVVGNILASGDVTAYSDERLKDNIQTIDGALGKVNSMRGVTYTKDGLESSGVIAQEIEKIAPELVKDGEYKSVAYGNLVGYLIEAIKEQQIQIEQSKIEIDNLKKEIRG